MKKIRVRTLLAVCLALVTAVLSPVGCGSGSSSRPPLNADFTGAVNTMTFSAQPSDYLAFSRESADRVAAVVSRQTPDYAYSHLYQLEEVKSRLDFDATVETHRYSALDDSGNLTAHSLCRCVLSNNAAFMAEDPFGYTEVEEDYAAQLCDFIVQVIREMKRQYPDVDWERVYCNLGNLKILYNTGMLSYAQVNDQLILSISKNNTEIVLNMKGQDGFSRVLTHEIMHIIQIGCTCETIENCGRRAGIAVYWDDFTLNTTDWTWMVEGSAERHMCRLTGGEAVSYQYKMDYLCSLTMAVLLRDGVQADTMETLCFYDDPRRLFDAFGCETEAQREELLNMMITLQVLQMQPKSFHIAYAEETGVDLLEDDEAMNQFSYALKPAVCITLAKEFYQNLLPFLLEQRVTYNDLFFLINLFEGHLNQHLTYTNASKAEINQPFMDSYRRMRAALFAALEKDNADVDVDALYEEYTITVGEGRLNADLRMLSREKRDFLAERAEWQQELNGLGQKVSR